MSHSLDVYVLDADGDPVPHVRVGMNIDGLLSGGHLESYTDDDGHAELETAGDYDDSRQLTIYCRYESFGPYAIGDGRWTIQLE